MSLREKIVNKLNENLTIDIEGRCSIGAYDLAKVADQILALLAPTIEKARKWDNMNNADTIGDFCESFDEIREWKKKAEKWDALNSIRMVAEIRPDEIYNIAAQSFVGAFVS